MEKHELKDLEESYNNLSNCLDELLYGSIRIRFHDNGEQYIYVRRPKNGKRKFELVGEFTRPNYDLVLANCKRAKIIRSELHKLEKRIQEIKNK